MVDYKYKDLYLQSHVDKQIKIVTDDGTVTITNEEIQWEQFELSESLCSENQLRFGSCEASSLKFKIHNVFLSLKDKWLTVTETLNDNTDVPFQFGRYKVYSDVPTADRKYRDVTAYDAMYDIINADVAEWYNTVLPNDDSTVTLKQFRTSFANHFGLEQEEVDLINDNMVVEKTINPEELSGKDVITAICELNGCFGQIGRNGKLGYVFLKKSVVGLYPANDIYPADDLYPRNSNAEHISSSLYMSCQYEDFVTKEITKLQIRKEENDIGAVVGDGDNSYIVEDNFLVYGKSAQDLETIADNLFSVISGISYRPFSAKVVGNPCFEVGDAIRLITRYEIIETYILQRTSKGIQALQDSFSAEGEEIYSENVNSVKRSIVELKGKTNTLERTVEETKSTIEDVESGLQSQITQNAESIAAEVQRATGQEVDLAAAISVTAEQVSTKVSKGDVVSEVNQSAEEISLKSNRLVVESDNFTLTKEGHCTANSFTSNNATITGGSLKVGNLFSVNKSGNVVANSLSSNNAQITGGSFNFNSGSMTVDSAGYLTCKRAYIGPWNFTENTFMTENYTFQINKQSDGTYSLTSNGSAWFDKQVVIQSFLSVEGDFNCSGSKSRAIKTKDFGEILQYCYETPTPMFGDIGDGVLGEDGLCYIYFDPVFIETISEDCIYYVFLQKEGNGDAWIYEKSKEYFVVKGTPGLMFSWEVKARQKGYEYRRLDILKNKHGEETDIDYELNASAYLLNYEKEILDYEKVD